jgi:hypothetical protein
MFNVRVIHTLEWSPFFGLGEKSSCGKLKFRGGSGSWKLSLLCHHSPAR